MRKILIVTLVALVGLVGPSVYGQDIQSAPRLVAGTGSSLPAGNGEFGTFWYNPFGAGPATDDGNIAFVGADDEGRGGVYLEQGPGNLRLVANTETDVPGIGKKFTFFGDPSISGTSVAFVGSYGDSFPAPTGAPDTVLMVYEGGNLRTIASVETPVPEGEGTFSGFYSSSHSGGNTAFLGFDKDMQVGVYAEIGGQLRKIWNQTTPLPICEQCQQAGSMPTTGPAMVTDPSGNFGIVFCMRDALGNRNKFLYRDGEFELVVNFDTPIPEGQGNFTEFSYQESFDGENVVFSGFGENGQAGIYRYSNGHISRLADTGTTSPNGDFTFAHFSPFNYPAVGDELVAFPGAGDADQGGIYLTTIYGEGLRPVVENKQIFEGFSVEIVEPTTVSADQLSNLNWWQHYPPWSMSRYALKDGVLTFVLQQPDGGTGIYAVHVER